MTQSTAEKVLALCQTFDIKEHPRNTYRMNSPLRPGSNSHGFVLTIHDGEHGVYHDKVTNEGGSLYQMAESLGIQIERQQVQDTKRSYVGLDDYAAAHGVEAAVFRAAGWQEEKVYDFDHQTERPALTFPTQNGTRIRFVDGKQASYKSPTGYKACWYGLGKAIIAAKATNKPLVICNGEASTVVAQHFGIPACAVTGGEKKLPDALLTELKSKWQGEIIIAFDCDKAGREGSEAIRQQIPTARVADLGLTTGGDLADLCKLYGNNASTQLDHCAVQIVTDEAVVIGELSKLISDLVKIRREEEKPPADMATLLSQIDREVSAVRSKTIPATVRTVADMVSENRKRLHNVMQNPGYRGLLSRMPGLDKMVGSFVGGRVHMLYGATNMGKSTLAVSLAREFISQGAGFVVPTEMPPYAWLDKLTSCICRLPYDLIEEGRLNPTEAKKVNDAYDMLEKCKLDVMEKISPTPGDLQTEIRARAEKGYKWVLIDSISKLKAPGAVGIYDRMTEVADTIQELAIETNMAFIVTSQVGRAVTQRGNKAPISEDAYGSGAIEQNADVILSLYNHNHYVELGMAEADVNFPMDSCLVRQTKHRWRMARSMSVMLTMVNGAGFYEMQTAQDDIPQKPLESIPANRPIPQSEPLTLQGELVF